MSSFGFNGLEQDRQAVAGVAWKDAAHDRQIFASNVFMPRRNRTPQIWHVGGNSRSPKVLTESRTMAGNMDDRITLPYRVVNQAHARGRNLLTLC